MITIIPQSISATSQVLTSTLTERLCKPYCVLSSIQPSVDVQYSIEATTLVGSVLYVVVKAPGTVTYVPKNGSSCCPAQKVFTEYFTTSFEGATNASTVTITQANGSTTPAFVNCFNVACGISAKNVVTLTFTAGTAA